MLRKPSSNVQSIPSVKWSASRMYTKHADMCTHDIAEAPIYCKKWVVQIHFFSSLSPFPRPPSVPFPSSLIPSQSSVALPLLFLFSPYSGIGLMSTGKFLQCYRWAVGPYLPCNLKIHIFSILGDCMLDNAFSTHAKCVTRLINFHECLL